MGGALLLQQLMVNHNCYLPFPEESAAVLVFTAASVVGFMLAEAEMCDVETDHEGITVYFELDDAVG